MAGKSKVYHDNFRENLRITRTSITDKNDIAAKVNDFLC